MTPPTCPNHGTAHERHLDARPPGARYVMRAYASWSDSEADAPTERHYYATEPKRWTPPTRRPARS